MHSDLLLKYIEFSNYIPRKENTTYNGLYSYGTGSLILLSCGTFEDNSISNCVFLKDLRVLDLLQLAKKMLFAWKI